MVHNTTEEEQGFKALLKLVAADVTSKNNVGSWTVGG